MRPVFRPVGGHGLLVEFGSDKAGAILSLDHALNAAPFPGLAEVVPGLVNLLVIFDPLQTDHRQVQRQVQDLLNIPTAPDLPTALHEILVCYDDDLAPDLAEVARRTGLPSETVIATHLAGDFHVAMYGFAPGYAYLAGLPDALRLDRKHSPKRGAPAGSVIIAGAQCLITTLTMPTGWWILGRSPARILTGDIDRPFLFNVADQIRFRRINRAEYEKTSQ
jgi:inhibitor of KinA